MANQMAEEKPTSTAATRQTEPSLIAAISSAKGRSTGPSPERRGLTANSGLLLAAGLALGTLLGWWAWRDR